MASTELGLTLNLIDNPMDIFTPIEPNSHRLHFRSRKLLNSHVIKHVLNRKEKWKNIIDPEIILRVRQSAENSRYPVDSKDFQLIANKYEKIISRIVLHACMEGKNHTHFIDKSPKFVIHVITDIIKQYIHVVDPKKRLLIVLSASFKESETTDSSEISLTYKLNTAYRLTKLVLRGNNFNSYIKMKMIQSSPIHPNCKLIADHR